jgi:hypothetical protein
VGHPSEETLKRFTRGTAPREEGKAVVSHLLKGCAACSRKLRSLIEPERVRGGAYDEALDRFDRGLVESLETSISTVQTLRNVLGGVLPPRSEEKGKDEE